MLSLCWIWITTGLLVMHAVFVSLWYGILCTVALSLSSRFLERLLIFCSFCAMKGQGLVAAIFRHFKRNILPQEIITYIIKS